MAGGRRRRRARGRDDAGATTRTADGAAAELPLENGATLRLAAAPGEGGWRFTRWQLDAPWQPDTSLDVWDGL